MRLETLCFLQCQQYSTDIRTGHSYTFSPLPHSISLAEALSSRKEWKVSYLHYCHTREQFPFQRTAIDNTASQHSEKYTLTVTKTIHI